jgi:hypothetical protein
MPSSAERAYPLSMLGFPNRRGLVMQPGLEKYVCISYETRQDTTHCMQRGAGNAFMDDFYLPLFIPNGLGK